MINASMIAPKGAGADHSNAHYVVCCQGILRALMEADKNTGFGMQIQIAD